jgi:glycosyltransferase involved in cell wall biosynthesis
MITIAITTHNRTRLLQRCIESIHASIKETGTSIITEILIVDDASTDNEVPFFISQLLNNRLPKNLYPDVEYRMVFNELNLGMSRNKAKAISLAKNDWVIIFDSDNFMMSEYLKAIENEVKKTLLPHTIYAPEKALVNFDYSYLRGITLTKDNASGFANSMPMFGAMMNTCNYLVPKESYGTVYRHNPNASCADTINFNYDWLTEGNSIYVVPNMLYAHDVHDESGFKLNIHDSMRHAMFLENRIKNNVWERLQ